MNKTLCVALGLSVALLFSCGNHKSNGKKNNNKDAANASPKNYKTLFENDKIRLMKKQLKPGESTEWISSPKSVYYIIEDSEVREHLPGGKMQEQSLDKGTVQMKDAIKKHKFENIGQSNAEALVIEMKQN